MSKYIIEVDDNAVTNNNCYPIVGTNKVLVSIDGLDGLEKYEDTAKETVKIGDVYYFIGSDGYVDCNEYVNDDIDINRMKIGNFFRTKGQAMFVVERLKVLAEMRVFAEPFDTKWDGITPHYYILRDYGDGCIKVDDHFIIRNGELYFESEERALECIEIVGEDRIKKYYIGVE